MITAFPPRILICIDQKYGQPKGYLHEDALQLFVDELAAEHPDQGWDDHDIYDDETVRASLLKSLDGEKAIYEAMLPNGQKASFEVEQLSLITFPPDF